MFMGKGNTETEREMDGGEIEECIYVYVLTTLHTCIFEALIVTTSVSIEILLYTLKLMIYTLD